MFSMYQEDSWTDLKDDAGNTLHIGKLEYNVRRYPKVLRRVSGILNKRGFAECKPILYFPVEAHFNRSKIDYI
jgi:hypothetical protein